MSADTPLRGLERVRVLVTDDDPDIQQITRLNLEHEGFEVVQATTGAECLEVVRRQPPDLILLDLMMPEMDGFETCRRLKSMPSSVDIPVIVCTARDMLTDKLKAFSFKADDYLVKPYPFEELLSRIYLHLNRITDERERRRTEREVIAREVLAAVAEPVRAGYEAIAAAIDAIEGGVPDPQLDAVREHALSMLRGVERVREDEDPYYESPWLEHDDEELDDDEDVDELVRELGLELPPDADG